jgi:hypothetical protein
MLMHTNYLTYLKQKDIPEEFEFWNEETARLICFETNDWDSEHSLAVKPYLEAMSTTLLHPFQLQHTFIDSESSLYNSVQNTMTSQDPLIYLVFHGFPGALIYSDHEGSGLDEVIHPFISDTEVRRIIYIGSCSVFGKSDGEFLAKRLLEKSKCEAVIGYTKNAGWYNSNFTEMLFISRFYNSPNPFYELDEIYNSVINDFAPATKIGLKMFSRKSTGN